MKTERQHPEVRGQESEVSLTSELEAMSNAIAARRSDPRTAAIVRRAFLPPFGALTLRRYLALEEAGSPLIGGEWPWEDAAAMAQAFCAAWEILFPGSPLPGPEALGESILTMTQEITRGFSTVMPTRFPQTPGSHASMPPDGLGWVPRLLARAITSGIGALDTPLDQLFILAAAMSVNEGAECTGADYWDRELHLVPVDCQPEQDDAEPQGGADYASEPDQDKLQRVHD